MGAGAVGCYFGGMLARSGVSVTLIGHSRNIEAIARHGLRFKSSTFEGSIPVAASTDPAAAAGASIILFCVKCYDTVSAAESLAPYISSDSIIISLQNGLGNLESIRSKTASPAVPAVVYVAANMIEAGIVQHTGGGIADCRRTRMKRRLSIRESPAGLFAQLMTGAGCAMPDFRKYRRAIYGRN
jgi:2-dehydropantoate 2-reductase